MKILVASIVFFIPLIAGCGGSSGSSSGGSSGSSGSDCSRAKASTIEEHGQPDRISRLTGPDVTTVSYNYLLSQGFQRTFQWGRIVDGCRISDFTSG